MEDPRHAACLRAVHTEGLEGYLARTVRYPPRESRRFRTIALARLAANITRAQLKREGASQLLMTTAALLAALLTGLYWTDLITTAHSVTVLAMALPLAVLIAFARAFVREAPQKYRRKLSSRGLGNNTLDRDGDPVQQEAYAIFLEINCALDSRKQIVERYRREAMTALFKHRRELADREARLNWRRQRDAPDAVRPKQSKKTAAEFVEEQRVQTEATADAHAAWLLELARYDEYLRVRLASVALHIERDPRLSWRCRRRARGFILELRATQSLTLVRDRSSDYLRLKPLP